MHMRHTHMRHTHMRHTHMKHMHMRHTHEAHAHEAHTFLCCNGDSVHVSREGLYHHLHKVELAL